MIEQKSIELSVAEAAKEKDEKSYTIRRWIRKGYIQTRPHNGKREHMIIRKSLEDYLATRNSTAQEKVRNAPVQIEQKSDAHMNATPPEVPNLLASASEMSVNLPGVEPAPAVSVIPQQLTVKSENSGPPKKRKLKKGAVRFAKDHMRHLDVHEMINVISWLQHRIAKIQTARVA